MPRPIAENTLFYGDNLPILRDYVADESVDLVYLDPPFNSSRNYNVLFRDERGKFSEAQIEAFEDTWHWDRTAEQTYHDLVTDAPDRVSRMIAALRDLTGTSEMMAYLTMMAARLVELHRVLKPTGSIYLHCDPTASHYLKIIMDSVFGPLNFRTEIIWKRTSSHNDARRRFGFLSDTILYYAKTSNAVFHVQYSPYDESYVHDFYRHVDGTGRRYRLDNLRSPNPRPNLTYDYKGYKPHPNGWAMTRDRMEQLDAEGRLYFPRDPNGRIQLKRYLDEMPGVPVGNVWDDILPVQSQAGERLGYPTQKPLALLERIVTASSNQGDVVLDPFCGCGTAIAAAQKLGRRWIGIDITHLSIALMKYRICAMFPDAQFNVIGEPEDIGSARQLAQDDRFQFQWWALSLVKAKPLGSDGGKTGKKGSDRGIDGIINFIDDASGKPKRVLVQVKSGHVQARDIRDLLGTLGNEGGEIGVFVTLEKATREMERAAVIAGMYHSPGWGQDYPKVQILTIEDLLHGAEIKMPPPHGTFKQAQRVRQAGAGQAAFDLE